METQTPLIVITNYQQYIDTCFLQEQIFNNLDPELEEVANLPEILYVSIAYFSVYKIPGRGEYDSVLSLSILGKTHTFKLRHNNAAIYEAHNALILNSYTSHEQRDVHVHLLQQGFEGVVFMRAWKIANAVVEAYKTK